MTLPQPGHIPRNLLEANQLYCVHVAALVAPPDQQDYAVRMMLELMAGRDPKRTLLPRRHTVEIEPNPYSRGAQLFMAGKYAEAAPHLIREILGDEAAEQLQAVRGAARRILRGPIPYVDDADEEPAGAYCGCADPTCPTPDGQYTHGGSEQARRILGGQH